MNNYLFGKHKPNTRRQKVILEHMQKKDFKTINDLAIAQALDVVDLIKE